MPNQPKTPIRTLRVDDDLWAAFGQAVDDRSAALRDFMRWVVREPGARLPRRPTLSRSASADQPGEVSRSAP